MIICQKTLLRSKFLFPGGKEFSIGFTLSCPLFKLKGDCHFQCLCAVLVATTELYIVSVALPSSLQIGHKQSTTSITFTRTMAAKLDPHHLVALMSYVKSHDISSHHMDPTSLSLQYGITDDHETSIPTFPILDSIASICVSKETSQVVAVALQVNSNKHKINLTIAQNGKVDPKLVAHLESVWEKLQGLSRLYAARRKEESNEGAKQSSTVPKDPTFPLRVQIFREIYKFSLAKQMKLMLKWWDRLVDFMKELATRRGDLLEGMEEDLLDTLVVLRSVLELVLQLHLNPAVELTQDDWELVYVQTTWATQKVRLILADREEDGCEILARELYGMSSQVLLLII